MNESERLKHNMATLRLDETRAKRHDELMSMPTNQWPPELLQYVRSQHIPFSGDALADVIANWLRVREVRGEKD